MPDRRNHCSPDPFPNFEATTVRNLSCYKLRGAKRAARQQLGSLKRIWALRIPFFFLLVVLSWGELGDLWLLCPDLSPS